MTTTISPVQAQKVWVFAQNPDGTLSPATIGGGGGGGTVTSIATSSPITGGPITTTGTIGCATCTTNAAALTNGNIVNGAGGQATVDSGIASANLITSAAIITNNVLPKGNGARGLVNSSITDSGTTVTTTEPFIITAAGAASQAAHTMSGALFTGGNGTTTFPFFYISQGATPRTTLNTAGTEIGVNAPSGFTGLFLDFGINGSNSVFTVSSTGATVSSAAIAAGAASTLGLFGRSSIDSASDGILRVRNNAGNGFTRLQFGGTTSSFPAIQVNSTALQAELADGSAQTQFSASKFNTETNCASAIGTCGSASSGSVSIAAAATTVTVATSAIAANSVVIVFEDSSLGTKLGVTCNTTIARTYAVTARTAGTSFVITSSVTPSVNPACLSYWVLN